MMECETPIFDNINLGRTFLKWLQTFHLKSPHHNLLDVTNGVAVAVGFNKLLSKADEVLSGLKTEQENNKKLHEAEKRLVAAALHKLAQIKTRKSVGQKEMNQGPSHSKT